MYFFFFFKTLRFLNSRLLVVSTEFEHSAAGKGRLTVPGFQVLQGGGGSQTQASRKQKYEIDTRRFLEIVRAVMTARQGLLVPLSQACERSGVQLF